jgi:pSer/pThr/pTyr-binding forkhead associated (FHA) protein
MNSYIFTILEGPDIGRTMDLKVGKTFLGRQSISDDEENKVYCWTLIDKTVSRTHAEIVLTDPGVPVLKHLSATNDTFVDGRKVTQENLQDGQVIQMGQTAILMEAVRKRT